MNLKRKTTSKKYIVSLLFVGIVSLGLGYSVPVDKVTSAKYIECVNSEETIYAIYTENFKNMGLSKEDMLEMAKVPNLTPEQTKLATKQTNEIFSKEYKYGFALEVLVDCLNK